MFCKAKARHEFHKLALMEKQKEKRRKADSPQRRKGRRGKLNICIKTKGKRIDDLGPATLHIGQVYKQQIQLLKQS